MSELTISNILGNQWCGGAGRNTLDSARLRLLQTPEINHTKQRGNDHTSQVHGQLSVGADTKPATAVANVVNTVRHDCNVSGCNACQNI